MKLWVLMMEINRIGYSCRRFPSGQIGAAHRLEFDIKSVDLVIKEYPDLFWSRIDEDYYYSLPEAES
jgi:hypothetical protein